jgi:hypothetical protein
MIRQVKEVNPNEVTRLAAEKGEQKFQQEEEKRRSLSPRMNTGNLVNMNDIISYDEFISVMKAIEH